MPSFRIANSLAASACKNSGCLAAAICIIATLCTAQVASAVPETVKTGRAQEKGPGSTGMGGHGAARINSPKKKIAIAQFDVTSTIHVNDISNIYDGLPQVLSGRLEASGEFLPVYTGRSVPAEAGEAQRETITRIAEDAGAQFLISGIVVNAGIKQEKGFLGTPIGGHKKRHIEVEFAAYDGLTGARLLLRRLSEQVQGDVMVGNDKPFGSSIFLETELGKALNRLIDLAVKDIRAALENVPFSAHIIRVEEKKVFLDAGSDSLLKSGDMLVVYVRGAGAPIVGLTGATLGVMDRAADTITLTQVQPQFSIGELSEDAAKHGVNVGNIAKIDPVEQRKLVAGQIAAQQMAKARQEAKEEAERLKAEQIAQAEAARVEAIQAAKAEAARVKAEKKAAAQAKAQAAAEAKAAKLKIRQEARAARIKAAQEARARELAREKARAAAEAKAARLKAKADAARIKAEKKAEAAAQQPAESGVAITKTVAETVAQQPAGSGVAKTKTVAETAAQQAAGSGVANTKTGAEAEAAAGAEAASVKKKPGVPLKLKQIKP